MTTAIEANSGQLKREVTVAFQGTPTHGYYEWVNYTNALYGDDAYRCDTVDVQITVGSSFAEPRAVLYRGTDPVAVTFVEGQYPPEADVTVAVTSSANGQWYTLYNGNIQDMIDSAADVYVRGTDLNGINGFAYTAGAHDVTPEPPRAVCENAPLVAEVDTIREW